MWEEEINVPGPPIVVCKGDLVTVEVAARKPTSIPNYSRHSSRILSKLEPIITRWKMKERMLQASTGTGNTSKAPSGLTGFQESPNAPSPQVKHPLPKKVKKNGDPMHPFARRTFPLLPVHCEPSGHVLVPQPHRIPTRRRTEWDFCRSRKGPWRCGMWPEWACYSPAGVVQKPS